MPFEICVSIEDKETLTTFIKDFDSEKDHLALCCDNFYSVIISRVIDILDNEFVKFRFIFTEKLNQHSRMRVATMGTTVGWLKRCVSTPDDEITNGEITGAIQECCDDKLVNCFCRCMFVKKISDVTNSSKS